MNVAAQAKMASLAADAMSVAGAAVRTAQRGQQTVRFRVRFTVRSFLLVLVEAIRWGKLQDG